ncbi:unnamed protein product [Rhodiola kirilowii]
MQHFISPTIHFIQSYPHLHPLNHYLQPSSDPPAIESFKLKLEAAASALLVASKMAIFVLEFYSQSAKQEALIVKATVDDSEEEILIFKGFSSSLSYGTSPDPSKSILAPELVVKAIDRVKGPFNPTDIQYIEKRPHIGTTSRPV